MKESKLLKIFLACLILMIACTSLCSCSADSNDDSFSDSKKVKVETLSIGVYQLGRAPYGDGRMLVGNGKERGEARWGYIDENGKIVIPVEYRIPDSFSEGLLRTKGESDYFYYLNRNGERVISAVQGKNMVMCDVFKDGYTVVELEDLEGSSVIDTEGQIVLTPGEQGYRYRNLGAGLFARTQPGNNKAKIVRLDSSIPYGETIVDIQWANAETGFYSEDDELYGIWNGDTEEIVTPPYYTYISQFTSDKAIVVNIQGDVEIIDKTGNCKVNLSERYPAIHPSTIVPFSDGICSFQSSDSDGIFLIDTEGTMVSHVSYDSVSFFHDGIAVCTKDGRYGYVDILGQEILTPIYDFASNVDHNVGFLSKGNEILRFSCY